jgi:hypothetical protein
LFYDTVDKNFFAIRGFRNVVVAKEKKKYWLIIGLCVFVVYVFAAARPIPVETILIPRWISSLESDYSSLMKEDGEPTGEYLVPFKLGNHFGYVDAQGRFAINRVLRGAEGAAAGVSLSERRWAEFDATPEAIAIRGPEGEALMTIENARGYPLFLDGKVFLIGEEQTSLSLLDEGGNPLWTYDFAAPLTSIDAAADLILTGSLDGMVELLDRSGKRVHAFEPGGSRLAVILGCRISQDGSRLAIISGYDDQRFLLQERFGGSYNTVYHEFLGDGFRHAVHIAFIENDAWIAFERQGGLGLYEIKTRRSVKAPLKGTMAALDETGGDGLIFAISSLEDRSKVLSAVRLPGIIVMEAPFKSETVFFNRRGSELYLGGDTTLASFELGKR